MTKIEASKVIKDLLKHNIYIMDKERVISDEELLALGKAAKLLSEVGTREEFYT